MGKIIGNPHWLLQPNYPTLSGEKGSEKITVLYSCMRVVLGDSLPAYDSTFFLEGWDYYNAQDHLKLRERSVTPCEGGEVLLIKLVYSALETVGLEGGFETYDEEPTYRGLEVDVPIELHPDYRFAWNHKLIKNDSYPSETFSESNWSAAGIKYVELSLPKSQYFKILKSDDIVPDGWHELYAPKKPGVETYKMSIPEVRKRTYSRNRANLLALVNNDFKKNDPPDKFGYTGEWLQQASTLQKEGSYWVCEQSWFGSKEVDDDLYS